MSTAKPTTKRPPSRISRRARAESAGQGLLPHEWLLKVMRGEPVVQLVSTPVLNDKGEYTYDKSGKLIVKLREEDYYATFDERLDAAKSAAPYYAPRLAAQQLNLGEDMTAKIIALMSTFAARLPS